MLVSTAEEQSTKENLNCPFFVNPLIIWSLPFKYGLKVCVEKLGTRGNSFIFLAKCFNISREIEN